MPSKEVVNCVNVFSNVTVYEDGAVIIEVAFVEHRIDASVLVLFYLCVDMKYMFLLLTEFLPYFG